MKLTELMIGDWVHVNPISNKVKPHDSRVLSIRREYTGQVYIEGGYKDGIPPDGEDKWYGWSVGIEDLSPIPLTSEILEKNGFEKYKLPDGISMRFEVEYGHRLNISNTSITLIKDVLGIYKPNEKWPIFPIRINLNISSVHELQHAMRLCGIEKEIVL